MDVAVEDDPDGQRFVARIGGEQAGVAVYRRRPDLIAFMHTEVDERFEGHGVGSALARAALDAARGSGDAVLPFCPFINRWIGEHPEYRDLVPEDRRDAFGL